MTDGDVIRVTLNNTLYRFELNQLPNNIVGIGNIRVNYNAGDSAATIAGNLATAINGLALNTPTVQLRATVVGNSIALTAIPALGTPSVAVSSTNAAAFSQVIGTLAQATDKVVVYFNQDQLNNVSANDPKFYQLLVNGQILLPSNVNYTWNSQNGLSVAVLTFAAPLPNGT